MEPAPLTKAHDHALAASKATKSADTTVAISEHTLAAGEFSNAAQSTTSIEALRTLKLLEQHHHRLSELLRFPAEHPPQAADADADEKQPASDKDGATGDAQRKTDKAAAKAPQVPSLLSQQRHSSRDVKSSIASNLASARGIRLKYGGQPLAPSVSGSAAAGDLDPLPRRRDGSKTKMQAALDPPKPVWSAQEQGEGQEQVEEPREGDKAQEQADDGYSRFYSSFGTLFNKLSAPLAFAGLPLIAEESSTAQEPPPPSDPPSPKKSRHRPSPPAPSSNDPDLNKIYSKATLRLMSREGASASDSFYVVPPSGHTMSYANILTFAEKEKRRMEASAAGGAGADALDDDDDFVDAREDPAQLLSPAARRRVGRARSERDLANAIEELCLENKSLKDMLDKLSRRLQAFEASAQSSSLALAESMRLMRPGSPAATAQQPPAGDDGRRAGAEERLAAAVARIEALEKDNAKMQKTLARYREKWEQLKESAKARRGQTPGDSPALGGDG